MLWHGLLRWAKAEVANALTYVWKPKPIEGPQPVLPPRLALKVDVDTLRGTVEGVPRLLDLLARHGARATFLFSLGPDSTGKAVKRVFRRGFVKKVMSASPAASYGIRTMLYGTLLPAPDRRSP